MDIGDQRPRGHLAEYALIAAQGVGQVSKLIAIIDDADSVLSDAARTMLKVLADMIGVLDE